MNWPSVPVIVMAGIALYIGFYHSTVYLQRQQRREDRTFALLSLFIGLYDIAAVGLYNAGSVAEGLPWQRLQVSMVAAIAPALLLFLYDYIDHRPKTWELVLPGYFIFSAILGIVDRSNWVWDTTQPAIKELTTIWGVITYYEVQPGPLMHLQSVMGGVALVYAWVLTVRFYNASHKKERARPLMLALAVLTLGILNDTAVTSGIYTFIYITEYCYLGLLLLMTHILSQVLTESIVIEKALQESQYRYRKLFEASPEPIVLLNKEGVVLDCNPATEKITQIPRAELLNCSFVDSLKLTDDQRIKYAAFLRYVNKGIDSSSSLELDLVYPDGTTRWIELYPARLEERATVYAIQLTIRDITQQKQTKSTLRELNVDLGRRIALRTGELETSNRHLRAEIAEREQVEETLRQRASQLAILNEIAGQITRLLELDKILDTATQLVQQNFGYHHVAVFTVDETEHMVRMRSRAGDFARLFPSDHALKIGQGMVGWSAEHNERRLANDVITDPLYVNLYPDQVPTLSEVCVPIRLGDKVQGVIDAQSPQLNAFNENDLLVLETVADQIAVAIENARLYKALSKSEERYRTLIEHQEEGVVLVSGSSNARFKFANPAMHRIMGVPEGELENKSLRDFLDAENYKKVQVQGKLRYQGYQSTYEVAYRHPEKGPRLLQITGMPRTDDQGQYIDTFAIVRDITERKRAEEEIARLAAVVEQAVESIIITDLEGNMVYVNPAFETSSGYTTEEALGRNPRLMKSGKQGPAIYWELWDTITAGKIWHGVFINRHKHGHLYYEDVSIFPIRDTAGQIINYAAVKRDISDRVALEAELKAERASLALRVAERTAELSAANAELARTARLKDEFLAAMSHELRTPLNAILNLSEILEEQLYGTLTERQLRYVHRIDESGRHLLALINDILDVAKIGAGKLALEISQVSVRDVCQASMLMIKEMARKKQLNLSMSFGGQVERIYADQRRLKQILVNLLSNAVKFTPEGGQVGLEVTADEDNTVHFTIWDTGIGIKEGDMSRLFQTFVQLDSRLSRQYEGTGLGLSLAQKLIDMHGGSIAVESEEGGGSHFTVSLPWQLELQTPAANSGAAADTGSPELLLDTGPTVLLAEDNETILTLFRQYLTRLGYQVIVAQDSVEAIQRGRENVPCLILVDLQMPKMPGLELVQQIRTLKSLGAVPLIAMTAIDLPGDRQQILEAGATAYIRKPISLIRFSELVATYCPIEG
ncbi:MAG: PAS domain S-box protein [Anaerolineae bacterium]|nr:PAS domain S-box protein [Anaerolineae bacterium]